MAWFFHLDLNNLENKTAFESTVLSPASYIFIEDAWKKCATHATDISYINEDCLLVEYSSKILPEIQFRV